MPVIWMGIFLLIFRPFAMKTLDHSSAADDDDLPGCVQKTIASECRWPQLPLDLQSCRPN